MPRSVWSGLSILVLCGTQGSVCVEMKSLFGVLSLVIVLVHSQDPEPQACDKTLGPEDLQQVNGHWVLVLMSYNKVKGLEQFLNLTSSHVVARVLPDNRTVSVLERNMIGAKCVFYIFELHLSEDSQRMDIEGYMLDKQGPVNISGVYTAQFLSASGNTMRLLYRSNTYGDILTTYRRAGNHQENLQKDLDDHRALAKSLGLSGRDFEEFVFDGHSELCQISWTLPTLGPEELHQVQGDWLLAWLMYPKGQKVKDFKTMTSVELQIQVHPDNHSLSMSEYKMVGGKCEHYTFDLTLPENIQAHHLLDVHRVMRHKDREVLQMNFTASVGFVPSAPNEMKMFFQTPQGWNLVSMYQRVGHKRQSVDSDHWVQRLMPRDLGLIREDLDVWVYDGAADLCSKNSAPEPVQS